jgi:glutamate synthase domain-containing protein 1
MSFSATFSSSQRRSWGSIAFALRPWRKFKRTQQQVSQLYQKRSSIGTFSNVRAAGASMKVERSNDFNVTKLDIYIFSLLSTTSVFRELCHPPMKNATV